MMLVFRPQIRSFSTVQKLGKILYTARVRTHGGRDGNSRSDDGKLEVQLSPPGSSGKGTNPEQLFAAGYSACFSSALKAVAQKQKITLPKDPIVDAQVNLGTLGNGYGISATLDVTLPELDRTKAQELINQAHHVCPYSLATRGNIDVTITLKE